MKEVRYFYAPEAAVSNELPTDEATHATRVLRLKEGDEIFLMDGKGCFYRAEVTLATQKKCLYEVVETLPQERTWPCRVHLAMAPTKMMERTEWAVEKSTEVGIDAVTFLSCAFSERKNIKVERIEKIIVSAVKQSRKAWMPEIGCLTAFREFIDNHASGRRYIAHCYEEIPSRYLFSELCKPVEEGENDDIVMLIGPEGDFSIDEVRYAVSKGFIPVSLGTSRLRTETAALSAVMMANVAQSL